jgi:hypothetical protein
MEHDEKIREAAMNAAGAAGGQSINDTKDHSSDGEA